MNFIVLDSLQKQHSKRQERGQEQQQQQRILQSIIPLDIFQTWHSVDLPPNMKKNQELLKAQNPEFAYHLYSDTMCREFIQTNFEDDVAYSFDKLKPGAYKADLWRYCVLYIHGGIYLDIKYKCVDNFKLLYLTDQEYWVRDRKMLVNGIYQALMVNLPKNPVLLNAINGIVKNCKNNVYTRATSLCVTGPGHLAQFIAENDIKSSQLEFTGVSIVKGNRPILTCYAEYRQEQQQSQLTEYYYTMWGQKNIYSYPTLPSISKTDISRQITKNINGLDIHLFSGTPTIIQGADPCKKEYLINIRWINYNYNSDGSKKIIPAQWVSLNSRFKVDGSFNPISEEQFLEGNFIEPSTLYPLGLEDIRVIRHKDKHYFIGTYFDIVRKLPSVCSGRYDIDISSSLYTLNGDIILPRMYDLNTNRIWEKNWAFVEYHDELCIVYKWFPLQIGTIDYTKKTMDIMEKRDEMPDYFRDVRGSTCGVQKEDELWFVVHKAQHYNNNNNNNNIYYNYQHFFAVFDLDMNLTRYSELFKFGDCKVEFCTGLIIEEREIVLSYSLLDTQSVVARYDIASVKANLKWYLNLSSSQSMSIS